MVVEEEPHPGGSSFIDRSYCTRVPERGKPPVPGLGLARAWYPGTRIRTCTRTRTTRVPIQYPGTQGRAGYRVVGVPAGTRRPGPGGLRVPGTIVATIRSVYSTTLDSIQYASSASPIPGIGTGAGELLLSYCRLHCSRTQFSLAGLSPQGGLESHRSL